MKKILFSLLTASALLLCGCASTITSQVTTFHEWPNDLKGKSFAVETMPGQESDPEFKVYAAMLGEKLQGLGYNNSKDLSSADLKVVMEYGTLVSAIQLPTAFWGIPYDPFWQIHYSHFYRRSAFYYPYYFGRPNNFYMMSDFSATRYFLHQLAISISERKSGKTLANIKVSTEQTSPRISKQMHYLLDSAFMEFPGESGNTKEIELPIAK
ncbi:MAG: DUF4136 domain-containing protein [Pseudomonadota bacterium]